MADEALLARYCEGDNQAMDQLMARYHDKLVRYATNILRGCEHLAEDVVQTVWAKVVAHAHGFGGSAVRPWLYTLCFCLAKNRARIKVALLNCRGKVLYSSNSHECGVSIISTGDPASQQRFAECALFGQSQKYIHRVDGQAWLTTLDPIDAGPVAAIAHSQPLAESYAEFDELDLSILQELAKGASAAETAVAIDRSERTVSHRITVMKQRLATSTLHGLVAAAYQQGIMRLAGR